MQPKDLEASEIAVRLGATWLNPELIKQFADELVDAPYYVRDRVKVLYIPLTGVWNVTNKSYTGGNIKATVTYGTQRANFYHILEESLNLRDARIFDTKEDMQGNKIRVLNAAATQEAQMKQQQIEDAFKDWIWKDPQRRQELAPANMTAAIFCSTVCHLKSHCAPTRKTPLRTFCTAATRCWRTWWAPAKPTKWLLQRWRKRGWGFAPRP